MGHKWSFNMRSQEDVFELLVPQRGADVDSSVQASSVFVQSDTPLGADGQGCAV